ncbi:unnamed protein product [Lactuca virosa]|uniref:RRM domain-containing protein n=1 Tax=Lactuca virosa TaxID=75947 RepID=A0AAU9MZ48_9ASTR|nr:unnamed protein product [Lactuca virosa]
MGTKKGRNGQFYAFIRFQRVNDIANMEKKLNGVRLNGRALAVNLAKYERKEGRKVVKTYWSRMQTQQTTMKGNLRDHSSFVEVTNPADAKKLMENEERWKESLKWIKWRDQVDLSFERVSWLRIMGLPLKLWSTCNFSIIAEKFGKIIDPFDDFHHRIDLSCVKIGIRTDRCDRINEVIVPADGRNLIKVGLIEFDEDWFPFRFDSSEDYYESNDVSEDKLNGDEEDDEGISDTWMANEEPEIEDGEIVIETNTTDDGYVGSVPKNSNGRAGSPSGFVDGIMTAGVDPAPVGGVDEGDLRGQGEVEESETVKPMEDEPVHGELGTLKVNDNPLTDHHNGGGNIVPSDTCSGPHSSVRIGLQDNSTPVRYFGPFRSCIHVNSYNIVDQFSGHSGSAKKCKRYAQEHMLGGADLTNPTIPLSLSTAEFNLAPHRPRMCSSTTSIDLNRCASKDNQRSEVSDSSSSSHELTKTVEVGNEVGFAINDEDPILKEVMEEAGEKIVAQ